MYYGNQEQDSVTYDDDEADLYEDSNADEDCTMGEPSGEREV